MPSKFQLLLGVAAIGLAVFAATRPHSEEALLSDWSSPPPLPVFIGVNVLAGTLRSIADFLTPPPIRVMEFGGFYQVTVLSYTCSKLRIPDFLATGPKTPQEIAEFVETADVERVVRLMYALAANGLTQLEPRPSVQDGKFRFVNSKLSAVLRSDHPNSMRGMVHHQFEDMYHTWAFIPQLFGPDPVSTAWDSANPEYPLADGGIWSKFAKNPASEEQFGRAMEALEGMGGQAMAEDGPWAEFSRFIDIGGSHGHFLSKLVAAHPNATGVLFDLPKVVANAKEKWTSDAASFGGNDALSRVSFVGGSFFDAESIPEAQDGDVYFMRYILHDWQDEKVVDILKNLRQVFGNKRVTLLIGECALPDRDTVGVPSVMYNIDMQMMAAFGTGKERVPSEWRELLSTQGFQVKNIHPTRSLVHWVEATPV